jgi:hypothetical protein
MTPPATAATNATTPPAMDSCHASTARLEPPCRHHTATQNKQMGKTGTATQRRQQRHGTVSTRPPPSTATPRPTKACVRRKHGASEHARVVSAQRTSHFDSSATSFSVHRARLLQLHSSDDDAAAATCAGDGDGDDAADAAAAAVACTNRHSSAAATRKTKAGRRDIIGKSISSGRP